MGRGDMSSRGRGARLKCRSTSHHPMWRKPRRMWTPTAKEARRGAPGSLGKVAWTGGDAGATSRPQCAAERLQGADNFGRPPGDFFFAQRALSGLENRPEQEGILVAGDVPAAEDLCGQERAQFLQAQGCHGLLDGLEGDCIIEQE